MTSIQRHYALAILTITYVFNFLDRQLLAILLEPIKNEFGVSDTAMGILYGLTFALFYATLAIPVARLADKRSRRNILAFAAGLWSTMTLLCGFAANYTQMLLLRIGVAVGEAGGVPPSQSLIVDYYPPEQRTRAMAIFSSGTFVGTLLAMVAGALIAEHYGWRAAFIIIGAPGILLAVLIRFTVKEPKRGAWDNIEDTDQSIVENSFIDTVKMMWSTSSIRYTMIGYGLAGLAGYGLGFWVPTFMIRIHDASLVQAGLLIGGLGAIAGLIGSLFGGWICDKYAQKDRRWLLFIPIISLLISLPVMLLFLNWSVDDVFTVMNQTIPVAILIYCIAGFVGAWWIAPTYIVVQELVAPNQRTLVCAILLFFMNIMGFGLGPTLVGLLSDSLVANYAELSIRYALMIVMSAYILAMLFYYLASKQFVQQRFTSK